MNEPAHPAYLRLPGRSQRFGEALDHYEYLRQLLRSELDADPLAETREIIRALEEERTLASIPLVVAERMPFVGRVTERTAALNAVEAALHGNGGMIAVGLYFFGCSPRFRRDSRRARSLELVRPF